MVSGHHDLDDTVDVESGLEPAEGPAPAARRRRLAATGAGFAQRRPRIVRRRVVPRRGPARAAGADGGASPAPAAGAPAWAPGLWPCALAEAGGAPAGGALAADVHSLERALAGSRSQTPAYRSGPQGRRCRPSARRRLRPVGSRSRRRAVRLGPAAHGRRGSQRGRSVPPLSLVAARLTRRRRHHGPRCGSRGRRRLRGGMGRRNDPRGGHPCAGALRGPRMRRRRRSHRLDRRAARDGKRLSIMAGSTDVGLLRRLLGQAQPYWPHVGALLLLSLLASPLSLLAPLPLKLAVDNVIGSHPLPPFVAPLVPEAIARSAGGVLGLAEIGRAHV